MRVLSSNSPSCSLSCARLGVQLAATRRDPLILLLCSFERNEGFVGMSVLLVDRSEEHKCR